MTVIVQNRERFRHLIWGLLNQKIKRRHMDVTGGGRAHARSRSVVASTTVPPRDEFDLADKPGQGDGSPTIFREWKTPYRLSEDVSRHPVELKPAART